MFRFRLFGARPEKAKPHAAHGAATDILPKAVIEFFHRAQLFDRHTYIRLHPDVQKAGVDPLQHFARFGIQTGRQFTSETTVARVLRNVLRSPEYAEIVVSASHDVTVANPQHFRVGVFVSQGGNFFMRELAELLASGIAGVGASSRILTDTDENPRDLTHRLVVAPHEFFLTTAGRGWVTDAFLSRATMVATEQVQSAWFARSLPFLLRAKSIIDINIQNAAILKTAGLDAVCIQPGYSEGFAPFGPQADMSEEPVFESFGPEVRKFDGSNAELALRPIDVAFIGQHSPRRERIMAGYAPHFAAMRNFIYYAKARYPLVPASNAMASSRVTSAVLQRSKILLNIHRDDFAYFEWLRLMQAFWQKAVVVSEPCFPHPLFKPGKHFLEESARHIPQLVNWLVSSPDGQLKAEEIRANAFATLSGRAALEQASHRILSFLDAP